MGAVLSSPGILYVSYDGMLEPLGQSQVLAYLEQLAPGRRIHLISFEKPADWADIARRESLAKRIGAAGIAWHPQTYHKRPSAPATAYDIAIGSATAVALVRRHKLSIIHARSYVGGLMALAVKKATGAKLLFDMRGLWADEQVDSGNWPRDGALHRAAKAAERALLLNADHIVTLTNASADELRRFDYLARRDISLTVIPTCADLARFTPSGPPQRETFVLGYAGSASGVYLLDDMLRCFQLLREQRPDARLLMINRLDHDAIRERSKTMGLDAAVDIISADHGEIPRHIARMSAGMALYKHAYSRIACAPTKLAEYLGCGVPCIGSEGVGDMTDIIEGNDVGVIVRNFSDDGLRSAVSKIIELTADPALQERCRKVAMERFSLQRGVDSYAAIYGDMLALRTPARASNRLTPASGETSSR